MADIATRHDAAAEMRQMLYGHLRSRALCAAVVLGIPEIIGTGCRTADELATATATDPGALYRLLRALAAVGALAEKPGRQFTCTPLGATLRMDAPGTAGPTALLIDSVVGAAWDGLLDTVRTGRPAFEWLTGTDFFSHLNEQPAVRETFDRSQAAGLVLELDDLAAAIPVRPDATVVDVGGGDGALLVHLLADRPGCRGVLADTEQVLGHAKARLGSAGLLDRCRLAAVDFLEAVPGGGDLYLLRHILHDWSDEACVAILSACRRAMRPGSTLAIIEITAPAPGAAGPAAQAAALMDLYMMSLFQGGRERTPAEIEHLAEQSGLTMRTVSHTRGGTAVLMASVTAS
jgi:hypothetical protein